MSTEQRIDNGKKATLKSITDDINNDDWTCLYYATYEQINKLISGGKIDEDFGCRHDEYQEEVRCMIAE